MSQTVSRDKLKYLSNYTTVQTKYNSVYCVPLLIAHQFITINNMTPAFVLHTARMHRNAIPGPGNLSLEHNGCKITGFHSRNPHSWAQQVSNLCYSNPILLDESFKFHIFTITNSQCWLNAFTKFYKTKKNTT